MKSTKHTPGPWRPIPYGETIAIQSMTIDGGNVVIVNPKGKTQSGIPNNQDRANARLIAAAPEMLEALERLLNVPVLPDMGHEQQLIDAINNATRIIKQAKG